jgi:hypothetical protein
VGILYQPSGRRLWLGLTAAAVLVALGCGGGSTSYPVHGTVYLDGQPAKELAGGTVMFNSSELRKSAYGQIQADGTYRLSNVKKDDGAIPGKYQVTVSPPETGPSGERGKGHPAPKPTSFQEPKNLEVAVERKNNDIPIQLQRSGARR